MGPIRVSTDFIRMKEFKENGFATAFGPKARTPRAHFAKRRVISFGAISKSGAYEEH